VTNPEIADLIRRVERLERVLAEMGVTPAAEEGTESGELHDPAAESPPPAPSPKGSAPQRTLWDSALSERFLSRVGIGFVLLALAFLLKLSFDRGWITPTIRLVLGAGTGATLLVLGLRLEEDRRRLAQVLLGGGVAALYLVGYAGFRLYGLLPFWPALLIMTATTFLSYMLSQRQDVASLAIIGVAGGLATPFLLDAATGDPGSLAAYASIVLLGAGAVQLHRGWFSLLATIAVGGAWVVAAMVGSSLAATAAAITGGIVVYWMVTAVSPLVRIRFEIRELARENPIGSKRAWAVRFGWLFGTGVAAGAVASVWDMGRISTGVMLLGIAGGAGLLARSRARVPLSRIVASEMGALTAAAGLLLSAGWSPGLLLIAAEACALWLMVDRGGPRSLSGVAHLLVIVTALLYLPVAGEADPNGFLLSDGAWARLAVLVVVAAGTRLVRRDTAVLYRLLVYVGLMAWFFVEFERLQDGMALVSVAWGLQGAAILVGSIRRDSRAMKLLGLGTLALVAAKLLLLDLATVDAVWRIFLFLGFGVALLSLSYIINRPRGSVSSPGAHEPETLEGDAT